MAIVFWCGAICLWIPIICHAMNNLIAFALEFTPLVDPDYVAKFQREWALGLASLLAGGLALWAIRRLYLPPGDWRFPPPAAALSHR